MTVNIPFDNFGTHIFKALGYAVLCVIFISIAAAGEGNLITFIFGAFAVYYGFKSFFLPAIVASNVKERVESVHYKGKTYNVEYAEDQKVQHPYFVAILLINILLGGTFFGWIGALAWACAPGDTEVPFEPPVEELKPERTVHTKTAPKESRPKTVNCQSCGAPVKTGDKCDFCGRLA
jgi:hypothetical protein